MTVGKLKEFLNSYNVNDDMVVLVRIDTAGESIVYTESDFIYIDCGCCERRLMIGGTIINEKSNT